VEWIFIGAPSTLARRFPAASAAETAANFEKFLCHALGGLWSTAAHERGVLENTTTSEKQTETLNLIIILGPFSTDVVVLHDGAGREAWLAKD
jgi:hypothetical protein